MCEMVARPECREQKRDVERKSIVLAVCCTASFLLRVSRTRISPSILSAHVNINFLGLCCVFIQIFLRFFVVDSITFSALRKRQLNAP